MTTNQSRADALTDHMFGMFLRALPKRLSDDESDRAMLRKACEWLLAASSAQAAEPVAWVRKHPDTGELSGDWLWNDAIEQCRKDSGVWFPLGFIHAPQPAREDHECTYENGDGICRECAELAHMARLEESVRRYREMVDILKQRLSDVTHPEATEPQASEKKSATGLGWRVRELRAPDGTLMDCFVEAPAEGDMAYGLQVLGDDYTGYGDTARKYEHCKMIVEWANCAALPSSPPASAPIEAISNLLNDAMNRAVANGADSRSMPDEYVAIAHFVCYPHEYGCVTKSTETRMALTDDAAAAIYKTAANSILTMECKTFESWSAALVRAILGAPDVVPAPEGPWRGACEHTTANMACRLCRDKHGEDYDRRDVSTAPNTSELLTHVKWLHYCLREAGYCIDGGKCHHGCDEKGDCWRRDGCSPLSGSHLTDDWKLPGKTEKDPWDRGEVCSVCAGKPGEWTCPKTTNDQYHPRPEAACRAILEPSKSDIEARFVAEHGHWLAQLLNIDAFDIADRDAQIMSLLKEKK